MQEITDYTAEFMEICGLLESLAERMEVDENAHANDKTAVDVAFKAICDRIPTEF